MDVKSLIILICFCLLIFYSTPLVECDAPFGLCANDICSIPIGVGKTILQYNSPDDTKISVNPGEVVDIFVKEYGPKKDLLGIIVKGQLNRGYISKQFIREEKTYTKHLVPAILNFKFANVVENFMPQEHRSSEGLLNTVLEPHTHTVQQEAISPTHSGIYAQVNNPSENLQSSQFHPKGPENIYNQKNFNHDYDNSAYDIPDYHSHYSSDYEDILLSYGKSQQPHLSAGLPLVQNQNIPPSFSNEIPNSASNFIPSNSLNYHSGEQIQHDSIAPNLGVQSSSQFLPSSDYENFQHASNFPKHVEPSPSINQPHFSVKQEFSQHPPSPETNIHSFSVIHEGNIPNPSSMQHQNIHSHFSLGEQNNFHPSASKPNFYSVHHHNIDPLLNTQQQNFEFPPSMQNQNIDPQLATQQNFNPSSNIYHQNINPEIGTQQHNIEAPLSTLDHKINMHSDALQQNFDVPVSNFDTQRTVSSLHPSMQEQNIAPQSTKQYSSTQNFEQTGQENTQDASKFDEEYYKTMALIEKNDQARDTHSVESSQTLEHVSEESLAGVLSSPAEQSAAQNTESVPFSTLNINPSSANGNKLEPSDLTEINRLNIFDDKIENEEINIDEHLENELGDAEDDIDKYNSSIVNTTANFEQLKTNQDLKLKPSSSSYDKNMPNIDNSILHDPDKVLQDVKNLVNKEGSNDYLQSEDRLSGIEHNKKESLQFPSNDETTQSQVDAIPNYSKQSNETNPDKIGDLQNPLDIINSSIISESVDSDAVSKDRRSEIKNFEGENVSNSEKDDTFDAEDSTHVRIINEIFSEGEKSSDINGFLNALDVESSSELKTTYQGRILMEDSTTTEDPSHATDNSQDENITQVDSDFISSFVNGLDAIRSVVDFIMSWMPEPLYSTLTDLQTKGISPRVPVFTFICGFIIILLIVPLYYIKEFSKEAKLSARLATAERDIHTLSATNAVLEEKLQSAISQLKTSETTMEGEIKECELLKMNLRKQLGELENTKAELEVSMNEVDSLRTKEQEYLTLLTEKEKQKQEWLEERIFLEKLVKENDDTINSLTDQLQETEETVKELEREKLQFIQLKSDYEEKLAHFERNCNQLLQEAEVWNLRVNELNDKLNEEKGAKNEIEISLKEKEEELESLKHLVETFQSFEELEDPEEKERTKEEKLQILLKTSMVLNQLNKQIEENKQSSEQLEKERAKILDMEVELLEAKSEIDKLKLSYNQALQDKAEAQTKLDVLTNYFKDKEIQLQKQLGVHEAVRQKKEEDATSAERRIILIEQENASYKYQVASMKQEMEETERNLKSQIAVQEKKAHENWIAARAAERKLEETKQEITQLRQRLTLLEREHENLVNTSRDDIVRPVPKRMPGVNDESGQDIPDRGLFPHHPPPMLLPPDRPLPPLPPMFMPHMERFRPPPPPWHLPEPPLDFRPPPPEFIGGRESTPPRGRQIVMDGEPHASSPITTDTRDSVNSTPPHLLPDFHDIPPQPGRPPFFPPPPLGHHRLPMHLPFRRDMGPPPKRLENPNEYSSRNTQQRPPTEEWQQSRV